MAAAERKGRFLTEKEQTLFTHFPKDCECELLKKAADKSGQHTVSHGIRRHHKIRGVDNEPRSGHRYALIVQDWDQNWIQEHPMESKEAAETALFLQRPLPSNPKI